VIADTCDLAAYAVFLTYKPGASPVVDLVVLLLFVLAAARARR
jgi:hypothetical protein